MNHSKILIACLCFAVALTFSGCAKSEDYGSTDSSKTPTVSQTVDGVELPEDEFVLSQQNGTSSVSSQNDEQETPSKENSTQADTTSAESETSDTVSDNAIASSSEDEASSDNEDASSNENDTSSNDAPSDISSDDTSTPSEDDDGTLELPIDKW